MKTRFPLSLESLGERLNLSPMLPTEQTRQVSIVVDLSPESGHECLVFFLGGVPSSDAVPSEYVFGTELPDADPHVRHRFFSLVDRTQGAIDGVAILTSSIPGDAELAHQNRITTLSMDLDRPDSPQSAPDGRHYKMLFAPLILDLDAAPAAGTHVLYQDIFIPAASDPFAFARDGKASGM